MIKISYVSDLHLEFNDYPNFSKEKGGNILLLAGDIVTAPSISKHRNDASARKLKKYLSGKFKKDLLDKYDEIYMVMGNHEHYRNFYSKTKTDLETAFNELDLPIIILDNDYNKLGDILLIGSTLWSDFEGGSPNSMAIVGWGMNDFKIIAAGSGDYFNRFTDKPITPEFILNEHKKSIAYIKEILNRYPSMKTVVMTHHGPTYKSLNKEHIDNGLDGGYCSDLSELILTHPQIAYWVSGHCHTIDEYKVGDHTTVLSNCRGYYGENSYRNFKGLKHIEV